MAVATGLSRFEGNGTGFRAWVFSIARRRIADHRRRGVRRNTHPVDDEILGQTPAVDDPEHEVVGQLSAQQAAELVVATLPADQADVILLRVLADLGVDEVAEVMGRTANWVRVTQHRALRRLANRLGPKLGVMR
jgi:RNA polymerase sigma-70 factor (ECF subfamily)